MRLGVIDVGSNTVHLLVVDAHPGAQPLPASKHKIDLRLSEHVTDDGLIADEGRDRLADFVQECLDVAEDQGVEDLSGFVTSAIREAPERRRRARRGRRAHRHLARRAERRGRGPAHLPRGPALVRLVGRHAARRRHRRWLARARAGHGRGPRRRACRCPWAPAGSPATCCPATRPAKEVVREARKQVRASIAAELRPLAKAGTPDHAVGTSKTMRSLARICGAAPSAEGMYAARALDRETLADRLPEIAAMTAAKRSAAAGGVGVAVAPAARRRHRGRGDDGPARPGPPRDLPVGAARGHHPAAPGQDELSRADAR